MSKRTADLLEQIDAETRVQLNDEVTQEVDYDYNSRADDLLTRQFSQEQAIR